MIVCLCVCVCSNIHMLMHAHVCMFVQPCVCVFASTYIMLCVTGKPQHRSIRIYIHRIGAE